MRKTVVLKRKIAPRIANGHPWVFANEVDLVDDAAEAGDIVEVLSHDQKFLGRGYFNPQSQIIVRLLTRDRNEEVNDDFFLRRLQACWDYRQKLGYTENCRLVFGEADFACSLNF